MSEPSSPPSREPLPRTLEPELMDTADEARLYDAMDHAAVNVAFAEDVLAAWQLAPRCKQASEPLLLDLGSGTARIPIELCRRWDRCRIVAVDAALQMHVVARRNIEAAQLGHRIQLSDCDVKTLAEFGDDSCDVVLSNTLLHHLAEPLAMLRQALRVLRPGGLLFIRDLMRPATAAEVDRLTALHAAGEPPASRQLLHQSLHAALTLGEARALAASCGLPADCVQATSDRHWTLAHAETA